MRKKENVLVVDDEWNMRRLIDIHLSPHFNLLEAEDGPTAISIVNKEKVLLVILDLMMPGMNGWEVCLKIRETSQVPILMLTARGEVKDKVQGFDTGADDYLVKPFNADELIARSKALIRRSSIVFGVSQPDNKIQISDLKIDQTERQIFVGDSRLEVTPKEFDLILLLVLNPKTIFTRDMLLDHIWGVHEVLDIRTVDSHVKNLREKLRKKKLSFNPIKTVWGKGYKFQGSDEDR